MHNVTQTTIDQTAKSKQQPARRIHTQAGGLAIRTDLRAGLAWDDLDDQAQELWSNLASSLSGLTGGTEASS
ncbi:MAG: hypothetical protein KDE54_07855 [Caldilineaceae bacterium]|nr:hypothetical protein [Caldilineaceae bacterium]MCB0140603.1 hypothetical protein [Caldilineaceae bacterium]